MTGDTIYNMIRLNELETDHDDRPLSPPKIFKTEVSKIADSEHLTHYACLFVFLTVVLIYQT